MARERLSVHERAPPLPRRRFAFARRGLAVLGGLRALLSGSRAVLRSAFAPPRRADDGIGTGEVRAGEILLVGGVPLGRHTIARIGVLVARERRDIAGVRDRVTLGRGLQACAEARQKRGGRSPTLMGGRLAVHRLRGAAGLLSLDLPVGDMRVERLTFDWAHSPAS